MADFQQHVDRFDATGVQVIAGSSDTQERASRTVADLGLEFTVLYDIDAEETSRRIGCYTGTREGRAHMQPADFILDHAGRVVHAVYSSGKVGRLTAQDALTILEEMPQPT